MYGDKYKHYEILNSDTLLEQIIEELNIDKLRKPSQLLSCDNSSHDIKPIFICSIIFSSNLLLHSQSCI